MLDFLKKILRKEEDRKPVHIAFFEIPAHLEQKKQAAASRLENMTAQDRAVIRNAAEQLRVVINTLLAAEFSEDLHPKLRSIARKSLPLYAKAIAAALEKPLPDETPEFYAAAADLLKICINSATGQGRYLRTVFPDEMKSASSCVAEMGRAINAMNQPMAGYRTTLEQIGEATRIHSALTDIGTDLVKAQEKEERMNLRMQEIRNRITACEMSLTALAREKEGSDIAVQRQKIASVKDERDRTARRYATISMTAAHVLRKAEKVARHEKKPFDEKCIGRAIALLSDHDVPEAGDLGEALSAAFIPAQRMIAAGTITLKNSEERALFSSHETFTSEISALCTTQRKQAASLESAEKAYLSNPLIARHTDLTRELQSLTGMLTKEETAHGDLVVWKTGLVQNIPPLQQQLEKVMGLINSGSDVQIHFPDSVPPAPRG